MNYRMPYPVKLSNHLAYLNFTFVNSGNVKMGNQLVGQWALSLVLDGNLGIGVWEFGMKIK